MLTNPLDIYRMRARIVPFGEKESEQGGLGSTERAHYYGWEHRFMTEQEPAGATTKKKLPVMTLVSYGCSMIGLNGMWTMMSIHLMIFYTDTVLMSSAILGAAMLIAQIWDAITDPILGYISDNTSWKWGRRRPYILMGSVPAAVVFFLLFSPPIRLSGTSLSIFFCAIVILFFSFRTIWETPYFALAPELTLDYDERTRLSAYQQVFATFGDILGTMAPVICVGMFATKRQDYSYLALAVAALAIVSAL